MVDILINSFLDGRNACYFAYSRLNNSLYLENDAGSPGAFPMVMNGSGRLSNSQCTINGTGSSVSGNGNTLSVTLNISFAAGFRGNQIVYLAARDSTGVNNSGWQAFGSWSVQ